MASDEFIELQESAKCNSCQKPVSFYCRLCGVHLCEPCTLKHLSVNSTFGHDIINIGTQEIGNSCFCDLHPKSKCSAYCKTCDAMICMSCASVKHRSHEVSELPIEIELAKCFAREKERFRSYKRELETLHGHTTKVLSSLSVFYQKRRDEVTVRGEEWHKQIEKTVKKLHQELDDLKKENKTALQKQKNELEELMRKVDDIDQRATNLQKLNDIKEMKKFRKVIEGMETVKEITQYTFPRFYEYEIDETCFGYIEKIRERNISLLEEKLQPEVASDRKVLEVPMVSCVIDSMFPSDEKYKSRLYDFAVTEDKNVWMGGASDELRLFDTRGNLQRTVNITCHGFYICMFNKQVVFSDTMNKAVRKISDGDLVVTMLLTEDWQPYGITETASDDLLICLWRDNQSKVVRYNSDGAVIQEIQYNSKCQALYNFAWYVTENVNGDIVVTDYKKKTVITVNSLGIFRYSYSGKKGELDASSVATDSVGHVLVTDFKGDKIHMLDRDGRFLRYIIPLGAAIEHPRAVCIINDGEMIVGECPTGLAKRIKFLEEQK